MSAAHIYPAYLLQLLRKLFLYMMKSIYKRLNILFAQGMEMKSGNALGKFIRKITPSDTQSRSAAAGIIDLMTFLC